MYSGSEINTAQFAAQCDAIGAYHQKSQAYFSEMKSLTGQLQKLYQEATQSADGIENAHDQILDFVQKITGLHHTTEEQSAAYQSKFEALLTTTTANLKAAEESQSASFQEMNTAAKLQFDDVFANLIQDLTATKERYTADLEGIKSDGLNWMSNFQNTQEGSAQEFLARLSHIEQQANFQTEGILQNMTHSLGQLQGYESEGATLLNRTYGHEQTAAQAAANAQAAAQAAIHAAQNAGGGGGLANGIHAGIDVAEQFIPGLSLISNPIQGISKAFGW